MQARTSTTPPVQADAVTLAAGTWLASGLVLLGLTPLPLHDASAGWTTPFWLVLAPAIMLGVRAWFTRTRCASSAARAHSWQVRNARPRDRITHAYASGRERQPRRRRAQHPAQRLG